MIVSSPFDKDLLGHEIRGVNTSYYGLSALQAVINHDGIRQDIAKYMYRDCVVDGGRKGVIIGFGVIINSLITTLQSMCQS